jgi:hypothetical protein
MRNPFGFMGYRSFGVCNSKKGLMDWPIGASQWAFFAKNANNLV